MSQYKTDEEVAIQRESCLLVSETITEVAKILKPGITTLSLDEMAETFIRDNGAIPACKGYHGYPYSLCISVNEQIIHGFPGKYVLKEGETLTMLARRFYGSPDYVVDIINANNFSDPNNVHVGAIVVLP